MDWLDELPFDAQQRREVFARFGLASYHAQCIERQIAILLAATHNPEFLRVRPESRDHFFDREFAKTLGRLAKDLAARVQLPDDLESTIAGAVTKRNWLTHHYFWERAGWILTSDGREKMIDELQEAADFFGALDDDLTAIGLEWFERVGGSRDAIERELARYIAGENA